MVDTEKMDDKEKEREQNAIRNLNHKLNKINYWLDNHEDRIGLQNKPVKSNVTDNESAKMLSSHGVIQGYNGIATVDDKHQLIVWAGVFGDINEAGHLEEALTGVDSNCRESGIDQNILRKVKITADTGFHNKASMRMLFDKKIDAYIPDKHFRQRDVRFENAIKYKKQTANWTPKKGGKYFKAADFHIDNITGKLICPDGKPMRTKVKNLSKNGGKYIGDLYIGSVPNCRSCKLRTKCIRKEHTLARQVMRTHEKVYHPTRMQKKMDTAYGRNLYSKRMGIVEPVFGHIRGTKKLDRFTLRGRMKVNNQWLLYCAVHNIGKIQKYGS